MMDLPWYVAYPSAVAVTVVALLVALPLRPGIYIVPYMMFFPAVAVSDWLGVGPGILAMALSVLAGTYFFVPPYNGFSDQMSGVLPPALFVCVSGLISAMTAALRRHYREREELHRRAQIADRERLEALECEQRARAEAEEANRAKDDFLAMLGHELRNPLAPIVTAIELIRRRGAGELAREFEIIARQVQHLSRLVDDLLDIARITRGKLELARERIDVAELVGRAIEVTAPLLAAKAHDLRVDVPAGLSVVGDARRLAQALGNILINAAKYTERGGSIAVQARRSGDDIVIAVRDTGIGMSADLIAHLFDPFVQGPRGRARAEGGLGLGLALARSFVDLHGGEVTAHSEGPGRGSEIVVRLPAAAAAAAPAALPEATVPRAASARRVLIVDDNEDARELLAALLEGHGYEVRTAHDGPTALALLEVFVPDVVLLDLGLPVMDGYEVAARLRERLGEGVVLVAVTGYGQPRDVERSVGAGFRAHLVKPVDARTILEAVAIRGAEAVRIAG
jgi:signal transduction histidine kinase/ActR/RegA family two-component response regulator